MVPAPPELTHVPGSSNFQNCEGPHLVLTDARGHDGAWSRRTGDGLHHELGPQQCLVGGLVVDERVGLSPRVDLLPPDVEVLGTRLLGVPGLEDRGDVGSNGHVGAAYLVEFALSMST